MSLGNILGIARSALLTQQKLVSTAAHNLANAATEGYSRQRLSLQAATPLRTPQGFVGRGVDSTTTVRARDRFLDETFRREQGALGRFETSRELIASIEGVMGDLGQTGLGEAMDAFFNAWSDLANNPQGRTERAIIRESAGAIVQRFRSLTARMDELRASTAARLDQAVTDANDLLRQIRDLNQQVVEGRVAGGVPDLEDRRDVLLDRLGALVQVRTLDQPDGSINVIVGDVLVADAAGWQPLAVRETDPSTGALGVGLANGVGVVDVRGGTIKALSDFTQPPGTPGVLAEVTLAGVEGQLDGLAAQLIHATNFFHVRGAVDLPGGGVATGRRFFDDDPAFTTARTIRLDALVDADAANIAAGETTINDAGGTPLRAAPGDGGVALRLAQLRTARPPALGQPYVLPPAPLPTPVPAAARTLSEQYNGLVSTVAVGGQSAARGEAAQQALVDNADAQRESVRGVSQDEELVALQRAQQAYAAAARIVSVADEMMQALITMI